MKVFVYYNLHRKCWSVKALQGPSKGRVVAHTNNIVLSDCEFKVSESGRQRVLRDKKKNVHAGVVGFWTQLATLPKVSVSKTAHYNPYKYSTFVDKDGKPLRKSKLVLMKDGKVYLGY